MQLLNKKNKGGFTVVEMLVVVAIILLLSGLMFTNYRSAQSETALQLSSQQLASDLRRAQNMALSTAITSQGIVSKGGYGLYFDTNSDSATKYILFAECNPEEAFNPIAESCKNKLGQSVSEEIESTDLRKGILLREIKLTDINVGEKTVTSGYITFVPPEPKIIIGPISDPENPPVKISITISSQGYPDIKKTITINAVGSINITN